MKQTTRGGGGIWRGRGFQVQEETAEKKQHPLCLRSKHRPYCSTSCFIPETACPLHTSLYQAATSLRRPSAELRLEDPKSAPAVHAVSVLPPPPHFPARDRRQKSPTQTQPGKSIPVSSSRSYWGCTSLAMGGKWATVLFT